MEIDVHRYFTTIPHDKLLGLIRQRVVDGSMLRLIKQRLTVGGAYQGRREATTLGGPQGAPLAPLYSNIYLKLLDQLWHKRGYPEKVGATLHRFADDAILVCRQGGYPAREAFAAISRRMGVVVNREKPRMTQLTAGGVFLGLQWIKRRSPTRGKWTLYIFPSKASQRHVRRRMKCFPKRRAPRSSEECVQRSNHTGRGGANSSRHPNASEACRRLQRCINTRFRRSLTQRRKGRGCGGRTWPNKVRYAKGILYIGSRYLRREKAPGHAL